MPRRPASSFHFTKAELDALEPAAAPYRVHDTDDPRLNLTAEVQPTGAIVFKVRVTSRGRRIQRTLGQYGEAPHLSIAAARRQARDIYAEAQDGTLQDTITLRRLWTEHYEPDHLPGLAPSSRRAYREAYDGALKPLHGSRIGDIELADIARVHRAAAKRGGPALADKARAVLSSMLAKAVEWGELRRAPAFPKPYGQRKRDRWLDRAEVQRLLAALRHYPNPWADYFRLLLFTGARMSEVAAMRWDQVRPEKGVWLRVQKGGAVAPTALARPAVAILGRRQPLYSVLAHEWVFPARRGRSGHIVAPYKHWREVCDEAALVGVRLHDLRHTHASWLAQAGVSLQIIGGQLGHRQASTTERYAHLALAPVQQAVEAVVAEMEGTA